MLIDPRAPGIMENWLRETDSRHLELLWSEADRVRREQVGDAVHLRGLIELSSHCVRRCAYCGLNAARTGLDRYGMSGATILECVRQAVTFGYGTVVLQAGEDPGLSTEFVTSLVRRIKAETELAVTLSLGERGDEEFGAWRDAGADRYLLRFETSNAELYARIHPSRNPKARSASRAPDRIDMLNNLRALGYEIGSGVMVGIPGQTYAMLASDIEMFQTLDLDMIGLGPYIAHPDTPLGKTAQSVTEDQVPATEDMVYKVLALARLACPQANIPSTTALATLNRDQGRELGLARGANVVMPNLTPTRFRSAYEIYPAKVCIEEAAQDCRNCIIGRIRRIGREPGSGQGSRVRNS